MRWEPQGGGAGGESKGQNIPGAVWTLCLGFGEAGEGTDGALSEGGLWFTVRWLARGLQGARRLGEGEQLETPLCTWKPTSQEPGQLGPRGGLWRQEVLVAAWLRGSFAVARSPL